MSADELARVIGLSVIIAKERFDDFISNID